MKIQNILNAIFGITLATLLFVYFNEKPSSQNVEVNIPKTSKIDINKKPMKVVYVNIDSLYKHYDYYLDLKKQLETKGDKLESEIKTQMNKLEVDFKGYQSKAREMTQEQLQKAEQEMGMREQNLRKKQELASKAVLDEQEKLNKLFRGKVDKYLEILSKKNGFDYILLNMDGGAILYSNQEYDITSTVINDLNDSYKQEKK